MTRIDFYILPDTATGTARVLEVACKLCDKATAAGQRVYACVPDADSASALDERLWTFRQGRFIAHERYLPATPPVAPLPAVLIGADEPPADYDGVLLNLGLDIPPYFSRFERVLELVDADTGARAESRRRFRYYRERGYDLATHPL